MKLLSGLLSLPTAHAALRFGCSTLTVQRLDPVVEPGNAPSAHVHQIVGGNAFAAFVDPSIDVSTVSNCTTCIFTEDRSNYWTAVLYFRARNGSFKRVGQYPNAVFHDGQIGGLTVYYTQESLTTNGKAKITAFRPGFRMTVGSPLAATREEAMGYRGLKYTCLDDILTRGRETYELPTGPCKAGIMAIHHFPA
jgi:hypothetical protein